MKAPVGLLSDGAVLRSKMEGLCPDKFRHDAQNADNARKNTAFPPVCKKCAKVCRAPENGKSHEESCDSSWDFGALEGTRIPGPLIKRAHRAEHSDFRSFEFFVIFVQSIVIFHVAISAPFAVFCKSECPLHPLKQCKNSAETVHLLWDK